MGGGRLPVADNRNWRITTWPAQGTQNKQNGIRLSVGTVGYRNFTRDLFEAEILVPDLPQPFHFFTTPTCRFSRTRLSSLRGAAEARAISNYFTTAADDLPVLVAFRNPYNVPMAIRSLTVSNEVVTLDWTTIRGERYRVESSVNLAAWQSAAANLVATTNELSVQVPAASASQFFRLARERREGNPVSCWLFALSPACAPVAAPPQLRAVTLSVSRRSDQAGRCSEQYIM